jgi:hypothetical protein
MLDVIPAPEISDIMSGTQATEVDIMVCCSPSRLLPSALRGAGFRCAEKYHGGMC